MGPLAWLGALILLPAAGAPLLARAPFRRFSLGTRAVLAAGVGASLVCFVMTAFALASVPWRVAPVAASAALLAWGLSALAGGAAAAPAGASGTLGRAGLLAVYSAGLAIPFLITALGVGQFLRFYQRFRRHVHAVEVFSGVLLLAVGGLIFTNRLIWLSGKLAFLNRFSR